MLENITTETANYKFGSTDLNCTVCLNKELKDGEISGNRYIAISLRAEDCFSKSQNVFTVTHIFSKPNSKKKYDCLLYIDDNSPIEALPCGIREMISDDLTILTAARKTEVQI